MFAEQATYRSSHFKAYIKHLNEQLSTYAFVRNISRIDLDLIIYSEIILYGITNIKSDEDINHIYIRSKSSINGFFGNEPTISKKSRYQL